MKHEMQNRADLGVFIPAHNHRARVFNREIVNRSLTFSPHPAWATSGVGRSPRLIPVHRGVDDTVVWGFNPNMLRWSTLSIRTSPCRVTVTSGSGTYRPALAVFGNFKRFLWTHGRLVSRKVRELAGIIVWAGEFIPDHTRRGLSFAPLECPIVGMATEQGRIAGSGVHCLRDASESFRVHAASCGFRKTLSGCIQVVDIP